MNEKQPWFVNERAIALASLLLTSRKDVRVQARPEQETPRVSLLVELLKRKSAGGRFVRVDVIGKMDLPGVEEIRRTVRLGHKDRGDATLPYCVFLFDVRSNKGFYEWILGPVLADGEPLLKERPNGHWQELDDKVAGGIIDAVNAWYDALALQLKS